MRSSDTQSGYEGFYLILGQGSDLIAPILMMIPVLLLGIWPDLVLDLVIPVVDFIMQGGVP